VLTKARSLRITALICGDRSVLAANLAAVTGDRIVLRCTDSADYSLAGIAMRDVPTHLPPGRGLRAADSAEIQLARRPTEWSGEGVPDPSV